jgi:hypothetical protein
VIVLRLKAPAFKISDSKAQQIAVFELYAWVYSANGIGHQETPVLVT